MAAKLSGGGGGKYHVEQNSEINVTPFVDIMLVLLIIFMVAAPLATVSIEVKLPTAAAEPQENPPTPVFISIQNDGGVFIGDNRTTVGEIGDNLRYLIRTRNPEEERIFIRADQTTRYGDFMQVMNALQDNGFYSVALVGEDNAPE
ncbi:MULTISPECIES: biopolymer transporter ExbD [Brevundimonas]|jgi:biopolymer transport protein ExbD|uniref:Biopolymer transport protein ExbD n=1 Tax=Brevundimonas halotolerans TaxID=69670 RepID=A0A7W9A4G1_9CAUL|nr:MULTISPECIES: biopolymer transporter ExbD [Brevundimonas]MAL87751.1 biopolymer transporter ExbD [Brevundimonas sp.]MBB5660905.1 biopolymer transport protein ExbD [Brevundimonas halotolerans]HAJ02437.1 biopolymer transporter ExbD [Brevundimonas sp.]HAV51281.1 biopolymer transporter ExbD [Brevundimonas sp.]|tara:strand:+ start:7482 stop:7919 length:438 start_codon:yes stop_codon:yes gene_type:complete